MFSQGALSIGVMLRDYDTITQADGLHSLVLDSNDFSQDGIKYVAQALRRNQRLRSLSMYNCKIDSKSFILLCEAFKYNEHLESLNISGNPLCSPKLDGVKYLYYIQIEFY